MRVRPASAGDLDLVYAIYARSKLDELRFELASFALLPLPLDTRRHLSLTEGQLFIAEMRRPPGRQSAGSGP